MNWRQFIGSMVSDHLQTVYHFSRKSVYRLQCAFLAKIFVFSLTKQSSECHTSNHLPQVISPVLKTLIYYFPLTINFWQIWSYNWWTWQWHTWKIVVSHLNVEMPNTFSPSTFSPNNGDGVLSPTLMLEEIPYKMTHMGLCGDSINVNR